MMTNVVARASHIAAGQWGLLTTAQAVHEGISRLQLARLADAGVLQRVGRGVYATTSSAAEHLSLRAAWLVLDPAHTAELRLVLCRHRDRSTWETPGGHIEPGESPREAAVRELY